MCFGRQEADFGVQLLLRLVHLLAEASKGRSHLPGNRGHSIAAVRGDGTAEAGEALSCVSGGGRGLTVGPDGCSLRW